MTLPNAENAIVDIGKLRDYSLNPRHERGAHKARVFRAALGLTVEDAEWLREQILLAVNDVDATETPSSVFGRMFVVDIEISHREHKAFVRTAWIVEHGTDYPRLTSCYVI